MTTNYEKIKNMTIEEMAEFLRKFTNCRFCNSYFRLVTCSNCKPSFKRPYLKSMYNEYRCN